LKGSNNDIDTCKTQSPFVLWGKFLHREDKVVKACQVDWWKNPEGEWIFLTGIGGGTAFPEVIGA
jgi:hypothetical protein